MHHGVNVASIAVLLSLACNSSSAHSDDAKSEPQADRGTPQDVSGATSVPRLPCQAFTRAGERPYDPADLVFTFDQLAYWYRIPGEFTHRLEGDQYGFETLSFIISETHPGGGPGLHVHDTEEAHVLLKGSAQYRIGEKTLIVQAPYVAKVPAGVAHTFINIGTEPFELIAVFATKHPVTTRLGPNPLIPAWESQHKALPCSTAK